MTVYKLIEDAKVLGPKDEKFGFKYWVDTDKGHVMFSTHETNFTIDTQIIAENATEKTSAKGNQYFWLTKVKKVSGSQTDIPSRETKAPLTPAAAETFTQRDRQLLIDNNQMLKQLSGLLDEDPQEPGVYSDGDVEPPDFG